MSAFDKSHRFDGLRNFLGRLEPKPIKLARLQRDQVDFKDRLAYHEGEAEHYRARLKEVENAIQELERR